TGEVLDPAISPDGKQLAYVTRHCTGATCMYGVVVQDVGGTTTRAILDGATAAYGLEWSPDRRNLLFPGTVGGRGGTFLLSALGGEPRWLTPGVATFYAGGDSLLLGPRFGPDSVFYVRVAALDGIPRDSIRIAGPGRLLAALSVVPGTNWILSLVVQPPHGLWQIVDRSGKVADHVVNACTCGGIAATDAVWLARAGNGLEESVVRIAIDRATGRFAARQDTMTHGVFTQFSLTSDGASMVMDDGTFDHSVWAVPFADATKGTFPDARRIAHASTAVSALLSPDGALLLLRRTLPTSGGNSEIRFSTMPFDGGEDTPLRAPGVTTRAQWSDPQHVATTSLEGGKVRLAEIDVRSGAQRNVLPLPDSTIADFAALDDGWAWIPASRDRFIVSEGGRRREIRMPKWFSGVYQVTTDRAKHRVLFAGHGGATGDSAAVGALGLDDGTATVWATRFAENSRVWTSATHDAVFGVAETADAWTLFAVDGGKLTSLGTIGRPTFVLSVSQDLSRAVVSSLDYRADAWLNKVVVR
ncbi:MAG TPA: hypothetical protein VFP90_18690, partial [Gemmatimonadaceae bacterium]|nr:hypothetical protein [Gemmatimonadaceae bacterium]